MTAENNILDACLRHAGVTSTYRHRGMVLSRDPENFAFFSVFIRVHLWLLMHLQEV